MAPPESRSVWATVSTVAAGLAAVIAAIYVGVAVPASTFRFTAVPMFFVYGLGAVAVLTLVAMIRGWRVPGMPPDPDRPGRPSTSEVRHEPGFRRAYRFRVTNVGQSEMLHLTPRLVDEKGTVCSERSLASVLTLQPTESKEFVLEVTSPYNQNPLHLEYSWFDNSATSQPKTTNDEPEERKRRLRSTVSVPET